MSKPPARGPDGLIGCIGIASDGVAGWDWLRSQLGPPGRTWTACRHESSPGYVWLSFYMVQDPHPRMLLAHGVHLQMLVDWDFNPAPHAPDGYVWCAGCAPTETPLATLPSSWLAYVEPLPDWMGSQPPPRPLPQSEGASRALSEHSTGYGLVALQQEAAAVGAAAAGSTNSGAPDDALRHICQQLHKAAYRCGRLVGGHELSWGDCWRQLWAACGGPWATGGLALELAVTIEGALRMGVADPRSRKAHGLALSPEGQITLL